MEPLQERTIAYGLLCFSQFLATLTGDSSHMNDTNMTVEMVARRLDRVRPEWRLAYAYGLLAQSWCELMMERYSDARTRLAVFVNKRDTWLANDSVSDPAYLLTATRIW
jgi:hypothetical protein